MWGELHESKSVLVVLPDPVSAGTGNRLFRELSATLHYDVFSFEAALSEIWQSESLLNIALSCVGKTVYAQDSFDEIHLSYPLATRPSSDQSKALQMISAIVSAFNGVATYQGKPFSAELVQADWDACNTFLMQEWGEEPGSEELNRMIEENYA